MARESKAPQPPPDSEKPPPPVVAAVAMPANDDDGRPGTSGTEMLLVTNRRQASVRLKQAQRAERTYKAKKRSAVARANYADAKSHYRAGFAHLKTAAQLTLDVVRFSPYLFSEKKEARQIKADERKRQRAADHKKKLEDAREREKPVEEKEPSQEDEEEKAPAPAPGESSKGK